MAPARDQRRPISRTFQGCVGTNPGRQNFCLTGSDGGEQPRQPQTVWGETSRESDKSLGCFAYQLNSLRRSGFQGAGTGTIFRIWLLNVSATYSVPSVSMATP